MIKQLSEFKDIHLGETIIVCGCGQSLVDIKDHINSVITIGVNDVPALFDPTYMLVTDNPNRFYGKRKELVNNSKAKYLFTCVKGWRHPNLVHFELGSKELTNLNHPNRLDHYLNSPYCAVNLAYKLGAKKIGLIGVDFTSGHFYNSQDGEHPIVKSNYLNRVNAAYHKLYLQLEERGVNLINLSQTSLLELPKQDISYFLKA
jgi:hypothetical protein